MATASRERLDMRIDSETKNLAERAAASLGCGSLTEFVVRLIRENAPVILERQASIEVTSAQFDRFLAACNDADRKPSARLQEAARRLDNEGF